MQVENFMCVVAVPKQEFQFNIFRILIFYWLPSYGNKRKAKTERDNRTRLPSGAIAIIMRHPGWPFVYRILPEPDFWTSKVVTSGHCRCLRDASRKTQPSVATFSHGLPFGSAINITPWSDNARMQPIGARHNSLAMLPTI